MSEINDADRRLLVCVAVAMELEPWGMEWGRGPQDPQPFVGKVVRREVERWLGEEVVLTDAQRGPGVSCHLLPQEAACAWF